MSQTDLAEALGPPTTVADIQALESARIVMPSWIRLLNLARALELSADAFLARDTSGAPDDPLANVATSSMKDYEGAFDHTSLLETSDESLSS